MTRSSRTAVHCAQIDDETAQAKSLRILWIDDEPGLLTAHAKYLRDVFGCLVEFAVDGTAGLDAANPGTHDIIILDWELPKLSGSQVLAALRAQGFRAPIIILTGRRNEDVAFTSGCLGAAAYCVKPIRPAALFELIKAHTAEANVSFASLNCDFLAHAIVHGTTLAEDPRTFEMWARVPGVTEDGLHRACTLLDLNGRHVLAFVRLLRAVLLVESQGVSFAEVLDVASPRTLEGLLTKGGFSADQPRSGVNRQAFLEQQTLIVHSRLLRQVVHLLNRQGRGI